MRKLVCTILLLLSILTVGSIASSAQGAPKLQYAVKFVCGKSAGNVVALGQYFTAINVHNPTDQTISFRKKFAIALPHQRPGPVSQSLDGHLRPNQALEIDCPDIVEFSPMRAEFLKGFAVIESDAELDVVAVYTAAGATGQVETLDIERVSPRRLADLVPLRRPGGQGKEGFCQRAGEGKTLFVTVKNQGAGDAAGSTTTVQFGSGGPVSMATAPIPAGGTTQIMFDIPTGCFNPDCPFTITVDTNKEVNESDEGNNSADGICIG